MSRFSTLCFIMACFFFSACKKEKPAVPYGVNHSGCANTDLGDPEPPMDMKITSPLPGTAFDYGDVIHIKGIYKNFITVENGITVYDAADHSVIFANRSLGLGLYFETYYVANTTADSIIVDVYITYINGQIACEPNYMYASSSVKLRINH